jgi:hypothetical protein
MWTKCKYSKSINASWGLMQWSYSLGQILDLFVSIHVQALWNPPSFYNNKSLNDFSFPKRLGETPVVAWLKFSSSPFSSHYKKM